MPKRRSTAKRVPSYLFHKPSGQARVRIGGKNHYLGPFGSVESHEAYSRLIAQHSAGAPPICAAIGYFVAYVPGVKDLYDNWQEDIKQEQWERQERERNYPQFHKQVFRFNDHA